MRFANSSTYFAALLAGATVILVAANSVKAQSMARPSGKHPGVVRPTDELPLAPKPGTESPAGATSPSASRYQTPSLFTGLTKDTVIWPTRDFAIPFHVTTEGEKAVEVQLLVSRGPGNQWQLVDQKPSTQKEFPFKATDDGLYWFATRTIDHPDVKGSSRDSAQPVTAQPISAQLKIFVDSTRPRVELVADADEAGRVEARVTFDDTTPLRSIQLHYVTDTVRQWQTLDVTKLNESGDLTFQPTVAWQQLSLQAVVVDSAGHQEIVSKWLQKPRVAAVEPRRDPQTTIASQTAQFRTTPDGTNASGMEWRMAATPKPSPSEPTPSSSEPTTSSSEPKTSSSEKSAPFPVDHESKDSASKSGAGEPSERVAATPYRSSALLNGYRGSPGVARSAGNTSVQLNPYGTGLNRVPPSLAPAAVPSQPGAPRSWQQTGQQTGQQTWQPPSLPAPASPEQVTSGFAGAVPSDEPITAPAAIDPATGRVPTAAPGAAEIGPAASQTPPGSDATSRPRTVADAMRPIADRPMLTGKQSNGIETIPTPENAERDPAAGPSNHGPSSHGPSSHGPSTYDARKLSPPEFDSQMWDGRVPTRYSDSNRFSLDYELEAIGANGADAIELWASVDGGKSWDRWGSDPDLKSPFDIETKDEGVFGFRIVVLGRNGLATPSPLPGETPDIVIVVDKQKPDVRITGAAYGEGDRVGSLVIRYACDDSNLMQRPIALSFSDSIDGPWTTIAAGLQNHGDYVWPADPQLPRKLYLRIDATDRAGNVGSYVLDRAIDAQGLAPRARIRGFQTLSGSAPPMSNQLTAERPTSMRK